MVIMGITFPVVGPRIETGEPTIVLSQFKERTRETLETFSIAALPTAPIATMVAISGVVDNR